MSTCSIDDHWRAADPAELLPVRPLSNGELLPIDSILSIAHRRRVDELTDVICEWIIVAIVPTWDGPF